MGKVTLTRPDGSQFEADYADVEQYKALGYQPESAQAGYSRNIEKAREEYFTSPEQRFGAGLEGFANGLTLGGYTGILGTEDEAERARYNPGTRLGGEIVGAILPSMLPGGAEAEGIRIAELGGELLSKTPTGLLTRGAEAVAEATTATKTGHALVRGAVEGAGFGAGAAITDAKLSGDPVTAESVIAGMGWGALYGGGIGYVGGKLGVTAEKIAAEREAASKVATDESLVASEKWGQFRAAVDDVRKSSLKTIDDAAARVGASAVDEDVLTQRVLQYADKLEETQGALFNRIDIKGKAVVRGQKNYRRQLKSNLKAITRAVNDRDYAAFEGLAERHQNLMRALGDLTKQAVPELQPFVLKAEDEGAKALDHLKTLSAVAEAFDGLPFTAEGFTRMKANKLEKVVAATEQFLKTAPEELAPQKDALSKAIDDLVADAGLDLAQYNPAQKLRGAYEALRSTKTVGAAKEATKLKAHGFGTGTLRYVTAHEAGQVAKQAGAGLIGRGLAREATHKLVSGLLSLAGGAKGMIIDAAQKFVVNKNTAKAIQKVGPKLDPLRVRLDGTLEQKDIPRKQLMQARMKEIREAAPTINDSLYKAVEPLVGTHTELAAQMNRAALAQFEALVLRMPRDPGKAFNRMQSLWSPDSVMQEKFARAYEVFHNPVGVAIRWLRNPRSITPEGARAMKDMNPELWTVLRVEMLNRLVQPGVLDRMNYSEQVGLGQLLDLRIHSTQDPQFIQAQQAMFQQRKEPLPARPSVEGNSNNPSGVSRGMTAAQRITEH